MTYGKPLDVLNKLSKIDRLTVGDHCYLSEADEVWYFGEYTPGDRYKFAPANQLIRNIKRDRSYRTVPPTGPWYYKLRDIARVGEALSRVIGPDTSTTYVPIPPSVVKTDPAYDARNLVILNDFKRQAGGRPDVRELIYQRHSTRKSHLSNDDRVTQAELIDAYRIDEACAAPPPHTIALFDDVLTTGTHFLAARHVLRQRFPDARIVGLVVCRRKLAPVDFGFVDETGA